MKTISCLEFEENLLDIALNRYIQIQMIKIIKYENSSTKGIYCAREWYKMKIALNLIEMIRKLLFVVHKLKFVNVASSNCTQRDSQITISQQVSYYN